MTESKDQMIETLTYRKDKARSYLGRALTLSMEQPAIKAEIQKALDSLNGKGSGKR